MTNAPSTGSVPADLYAAAVRVWPKSRVATRGRSPSTPRPVHPVVAAIGAPLYEERAVALVGMLSGLRRYFGACRHDGHSVYFDFWFPHLGIAVDVEDSSGGTDAFRPWSRQGRSGLVSAGVPAPTRRLDDGELTAKTEWCAAQGVVYVAPEDARDVEMLRELAARRRGELADG